MDQLFELTQIKKKKLTRDLSYDYVCIWEHDWVKLDIQDRLDPRESFFGGRTNAAKLYYQVAEEEKIKYVDFTR